MTDTFITRVEINKARHLSNLTVRLSETGRQHLIITGKNGSGKTSVLKAMRKWIVTRQEDVKEPDVIVYRGDEEKPLPDNVTMHFNTENLKTALLNTLFLYTPTHHELIIAGVKYLEKVDIDQEFLMDTNASSDFLNICLI
jgi:ABC-type cobalamin/Fe3+-siderophores transport system ATPase subunit